MLWLKNNHNLKMKLKKRGAIEVQFNWIFILIAGAVILLFFGTIIVKQRAASEQKMAASLLIDLESIMTGSMVSDYTWQPVFVSNKEINFEGCDFYYIGKKKEFNTKLKKDIKEKVIFAPDLIKGTIMTTGALPWNIPYRVTNFLYLTSPQVRYVIVANDVSPGSFADKINKLLPPKTITVDDEEYNVMFRDATTSPSFNDLNNYKVKYVFLDSDPYGNLNAFSDMEDEDVRAIKIDGDMEGGTIFFYIKEGISFQLDDTQSLDLDGSSPYLREASLIGAIFAEDEKMYECAMMNAFKRMGVVSEVYYKRTFSLNSIYAGCYNDALPLLLNIISLSGDLANSDVIKSRGDSLKLQDKNCPLVY